MHSSYAYKTHYPPPASLVQVPCYLGSPSSFLTHILDHLLNPSQSTESEAKVIQCSAFDTAQQDPSLHLRIVILQMVGKLTSERIKESFFNKSLIRAEERETSLRSNTRIGKSSSNSLPRQEARGSGNSDKKRRLSML